MPYEPLVPTEQTLAKKRAADDARVPSALVLGTLAEIGDKDPHWKERYALTRSARERPQELRERDERLALGILTALTEGHSVPVAGGLNGISAPDIKRWYKYDPEFEALAIEAQLRSLSVDEECLLRERNENWKVAMARVQNHPLTRDTWAEPSSGQRDRGITIVLNWSRDGDKHEGPETVTIEAPSRDS